MLLTCVYDLLGPTEYSSLVDTFKTHVIADEEERPQTGKVNEEDSKLDDVDLFTE